ncbi:hypothetical protein ACFDTO_20865 [Microbacteriaceae bacterium 4G12]
MSDRPESEQSGADRSAAAPKKRGPRRARTQPVAGSDPTPQREVPGAAPVRASEDTDQAWGDRPASGSGENDERLRRDVPPHWG